MTHAPLISDGDGLGDLHLLAARLTASLRWQLGRFRLATLNPRGLRARRGVYAGRIRAFTLLSGMPKSDPVVIDHALQVGLTASASSASTTPSTDTGNGGTGDGRGGNGSTESFDTAVTAAFARWGTLDLRGFWAAVSDYAKATKPTLSEQVLLLTYFETILPVDAAADPATDLSKLPDEPAGADAAHPVPDVTDLAAAVSSLAVCAGPSDIYAACSTMTICGAEVSTSFAVQAALLTLAMIAPDLTGTTPP